MKRAMLFFERFMYIDGVTPIHCVMTARIQGCLDAAHLEAALVKLQAKHPLLQARVVEEGGVPSFVVDEEDEDTPSIPLHIAPREGDDDWRTATVAEWKQPFDMRAGPLFRVRWLRSETTSDLMLIAHHCICDGASLMTLMRDLLQVTDRPESELTPYAAYTSLADLIPADVLADSETQRQVNRKARLYKIFLAVLGRRRVELPAGDPYALYWSADVAEFAAINARCIAEDTNPYATLCVAYLLAFRQVQGRSARNKIMCPVSIRRFLRSIKSDMMFAFAPTVELSLEKEAQGDLWAQARQMKRSIGEKIEAMKAYEDLLLGDRMLPDVPRLVNFLRSSRGGHDLAFSNVGRLKIPSKYTGFTLERIIGASVAVPWRNTNTLLMTHFQNELNLSFISNERFLPQREAAAIQNVALGLLREAMQRPKSN